MFDPVSDSFLLDQVPVPFSYLHGVLRSISDRTYQQVAHYFFWGNSSPRMAIDSSNGTVLFTNVTGELLYLNPRNLSVLGSVAVPPRVTGVLYDAATDEIDVASSCDPGNLILEGHLTVLDASTGANLSSLSLPCSPSSMVADTSNGNLFVLAGSEGNLTVVSGANHSVLGVLTNVAPGEHGALTMTFDPLNGRVYLRCANATSPGCVDVLNGTTGALVSSTLLPEQVQDNFAVERDGTVAFLAWTNTSGSSREGLYTLDPGTGTVAEVASAPCFEDVLGYNNVSGDLFAASHCGDLGQYGGAAVYATQPYGLLDEITSVNNSYQEFFSSGDTSTYAPGTGDMLTSFLVTGGGSGDFLFGPYPVSFHAQVYAPGVVWTVRVSFPNGWSVSVSADVPTSTIWVANGSYSFAWEVPPGFSSSAAGGSFVMAGAPLRETATISWAWWAWTTLLVGVALLVIGMLRGRRYRFDFHVRRAQARAKLAYDLDHPLSGPAPGDRGRPPKG